MGILNDKLIDVKADLCWNHQQEQLLGKVKIDCICGQLLDMIAATREEIAKEIEAIYIRDVDNVKPIHFARALQGMAISIARGTK